jgi:hypothetical protein
MAEDVTALATPRVEQSKFIQRRLQQRAAELWRELERGDIDRAWRAIAPRLNLAVLTSQRASSEDASAYVDSVISRQGATSRRLASVPARSFVGYAADGRDLDGALVQPMIRLRRDLDAGLPRRDALARGERATLRLVTGLVGDTRTVADGTALALQPAAEGYVRRVSVPACGRCIVLAGKFFARNAGFKRHPRCDCTHVAVTRSWAAPSPDELLSRMTPEQRVAALGKGNAEAVAAGADVAQVVNARRGMSSAADRFTSASTSKRGVMPGGQRMTPAALLDRYGDDPEKFRDALRANGYLS